MSNQHAFKDVFKYLRNNSIFRLVILDSQSADFTVKKLSDF